MHVKAVLRGEGQSCNVLGDNQTFKLTGKDTNGQLLTVFQDNPPNTQLPMHVHANEDELYRIIEGEVEFTADGRTSLLKGGDTIFLPRGIPHTWKVVGTQNAKMYLDILPAGLEEMFEELSRLPVGPPDMNQLTEICGRYGITFV